MAFKPVRREKILLAQRSDALSAYAQALRVEGYDTHEVTSAAAALGKIVEGSVDVAIVDDDLNDRNAVELLRAAGRRVPIIVCSASWNVTRAVEAMKEGACDYLSRPMQPRDLLRAVASACQTRADGREGRDDGHSKRDGPSSLAPHLSTVRLEQRRRQAQKMELFGRLASGVIHDFNNLLTVILGYCDILSTRLGPDDPLRGYVDEIDRVAVNGSGLTHQLLAFGRNQTVDSRLLNLNVVLAQMEAMLARLIGQRIHLVLRVDPDLGLIRMPHSQLEQVIMNLVVNARDAMLEGGTLLLETTNLRLTAPRLGLAAGDYVVLRVRDTGCGMDTHTKAHLFEPFFTTKDDGAGTGLGLSIVSSIVHAIGGHIDVDSQLGQGTTLTLYFPRAEQAAPPGVPRPLHRKNAQGTSS